MASRVTPRGQAQGQSSKLARWARQAILLLALLLAWTSITQAGSMVFQARSPSLALRFDADDPVALVRSARADVTAGSGGENSGAKAINAASRSIAQNPLNADAFGLYGLVRMANADLDVVGNQVAMADRLSRRDISTQLFLIEDAVRRNDVAAALRHYDAAMRVREGVRPTLYPILTEAIREPAIRKRFLPYMNATTPWLETFLSYAGANTKDPTSLADLVIEAGGMPKGDAFASKIPGMLSLLVQVNELQKAEEFYRRVGKGEASLLTDAAFSEANTDPLLTPFTWQPYLVGEIDPMFVVGNDGELEFEARMTSGFSGYVLRKLFTLPSGASYTLSGTAQAEGQDPTDTFQIQVACESADGRTIISSDSIKMEPDATYRQAFTVPQGCRYQMVSILADTRVSSSNVELTLSSPEIARRSAR